MLEEEQLYVVKLSETALVNLVMNGLEAYCIKNSNTRSKNKSELEIYGNLFGHVSELSSGHTLFHIELINTDTTPKQSNDSVQYSVDAIRLKRDITRSFWPNYQYIGDFHTHPYGHYRDVEKIEGFYLSDGDREDLDENSKFFQSIGHRLSLLLTIGRMDRAGKAGANHEKSNNCIQFTIGNFRLWLTAYVSSHTEDGEFLYTDDRCDEIYLDCPTLTGFSWIYDNFGRVKGKGNSLTYISQCD